MSNPYSIEDAVKIAELSTEFGEQMQWLKRAGLGPELKTELGKLLRNMIPYRPVFELFIQAYVERDKAVREYKGMLAEILDFGIREVCMGIPECKIHNTPNRSRNMIIYYQEEGEEKKELGLFLYCKECECGLKEGELESKLMEIGNSVLRDLPWYKGKDEIPKCTRIEIL